jgi:hypothetical protein
VGQGIVTASTTETKTSGEKLRATLETAGKWIAIGLSVIGFVWTVYTFLFNNSVQARKPFFDYQLATYKQAIQTVQVLATSDNRESEEWKTNLKKFYQLFWGEMGFVEDRPVANAMIDIRDCIQNPACSRADLETYSLKLAHATRDSVAASWGVSNSFGLPIKNQ